MIVNAKEYIHNVAKYQDIAMREPVIITRYGRAQTVLLPASYFTAAMKSRLAGELPGDKVLDELASLGAEQH